MSSSTSADANFGGDHADFELWVGPFEGRALKVVSFEGREAMSRLFSFDVRVLADAGEDLLEAALIGLPATLLVQVSGRAPRVVQGIVASIREEGGATRGGRRSFEIRLVPRLWLLKKRIASRVFQNLTVPEIVARVLDDAHVPGAWKLVREYAKRAYCLQYRESDFAFVARITAEEGLFWYFDQPAATGDDSAARAETVVFLDDAQGYPSIADGAGAVVEASVSAAAVAVFASGGAADGAHLHLREHRSSAREGGDEVSRFARTQSLASRAVLLRDYDFRRPRLDLQAEAKARSAPGDLVAATPGLVTGELRVYEHRGEYDDPEVDPRRAEMHLEQRRRRVEVGEGESNCRRLAPGYRFWLDAEATPTLTREYVVTEVRHEGHAPEYTERSASNEGPQVYKNRFECIPATVPARPKRPKQKVQNVLESALVVGPANEEIYTDVHGRIKIQFHWDLQGGKNEHSSCWIRVAQAWAGASFGMQLIPRVGMEVMVAFLGGDQDCPVVTGCVHNATHPTTFPLPADRTRSGLRTQSSPGGGGFNELSFEDAKRAEQIYLHAQRDLDEVVERNHDLVVKGDETVHIQGQQVHTIDGSRVEQVQGRLSRAVASDESVHVDGNRVDVVAGNSDQRVSGELKTRIGRERREVTGRADLVVADDYTVRTRGCYTTLVGKDGAKRSYVLRVEGTAQLSSSGVMEIDTEKGLTLKCGKSFIKITSEKIEICSPSVSAKGDGGGISVAKDKVKVSAKGEAVVTAEKILWKTPDASVSMKTDVQIDGKKILLNSPDMAKDPVPDTSPPPTKIQMKDQSGKPLSNQRFVITLGDGSEYSGILDKDGKTEMEFEGSGTIVFPDLAKPGAS